MRIATRLSLLGAATAALMGAGSASAAEFLFNFTGTGFFGGTLNGTGTVFTSNVPIVQPNGFTAQSVTGITGTFNGSTITGLAPGVFGANNLFYTSGPFFVDGNGLSFTTAAGVSANLFVTNGTSYRVNTQGAGLLTGLVTASATPVTSAVPEPASWAMMIGGFGLIGGAMRRRVSKVATQVAFA